MCGIAGIIKNKGEGASFEILSSMTQALEHRGPDEEGYFLEGEAGLGVRRLSIIDLEGGTQPMHSPCGRYHIVFNGEIYNHSFLRQRCEEKGYLFKTRSDTEVILSSFIFWGPDALESLDGMFAIALYDSQENLLFLARDRLGVKPLYYSFLPDGTFIFASEIKALFRYPGLKAEMDIRALDNLFSFGFQLCPGAFFKHIEQLLPGHYVLVTPEKIRQFSYWDLDPKRTPLKGEMPEMKEAFMEHLQSAVTKRLVSDVPVGAYLSGGIDSSAVSMLYAGLKPEGVSTFSIGFPHPDYNEERYSTFMAQTLKTRHTYFMCDPQSGDFEKMIRTLEEPMLTLLHLPLFYLSKTVHEAGFKVVLSGDGADELLGGYDYFRLLKIFQFVRKHPGMNPVSLYQRVFSRLETRTSCQNYHQYILSLNKILPPFFKNTPYFYLSLLRKEELFSEELKQQLSETDGMPLPFDPKILEGADPWEQMFYLESKLRLLSLTLPLSDKMSMVHSVENRSPFMDYKLWEFAYSLPMSYKISGLKEKYILKKSMQGRLPPEIVKRRKQPLSAPSAWFLKILGDSAEDLLTEKVIREKGLFNPDYILNVRKSAALNPSEDISPLLFMVYWVHLWHETWIKKGSF